MTLHGSEGESADRAPPSLTPDSLSASSVPRSARANSISALSTDERCASCDVRAICVECRRLISGCCRFVMMEDLTYESRLRCVDVHTDASNAVRLPRVRLATWSSEARCAPNLARECRAGSAICLWQGTIEDGLGKHQTLWAGLQKLRDRHRQ